MVSRRLHATHIGGCGCCIGLGTTLRGGIRRSRELHPANGSSTSMWAIASIASSHISRLRARRIPKPPSSAAELDSPLPNSTRPSDTRSSVAIRSATRAGWLTCGMTLTIPWPILMFFVLWLAAARNTSGADECEYSSMKWCSTTHAWSKPSWSPSRACSRLRR